MFTPHVEIYNFPRYDHIRRTAHLIGKLSKNRIIHKKLIMYSNPPPPQKKKKKKKKTKKKHTLKYTNGAYVL